MLSGQGGPAQGAGFASKPVGHELVSPVPPDLRRVIILETRSVSFLDKCGPKGYSLNVSLYLTGVMCQMFSAYSRMERSEEKKPAEAMLTRDLRFHVCRSR